MFALASLDRIRTLDRQRIVRDVPGWRLAAPVFSLLAGLYAQVERRAASRLVITRRSGFELLATPDGGAEPRDTLQAAYGEAFLIFPSEAPGDTGRASSRRSGTPTRRSSRRWRSTPPPARRCSPPIPASRCR